MKEKNPSIHDLLLEAINTAIEHNAPIEIATVHAKSTEKFYKIILFPIEIEEITIEEVPLPSEEKDIIH